MKSFVLGALFGAAVMGYATGNIKINLGSSDEGGESESPTVFKTMRPKDMP